MLDGTNNDGAVRKTVAEFLGKQDDGSYELPELSFQDDTKAFSAALAFLQLAVPNVNLLELDWLDVMESTLTTIVQSEVNRLKVWAMQNEPEHPLRTSLGDYLKQCKITQAK